MKHLVTLASLVIACVLYGVGLKTGAVAAFGMGILFELAFWARLLTGGKKS